jgi:hypothetical protein
MSEGVLTKVPLIKAGVASECSVHRSYRLSGTNIWGDEEKKKVSSVLLRLLDQNQSSWWTLQRCSLTYRRQAIYRLHLAKVRVWRLTHSTAELTGTIYRPEATDLTDSLQQRHSAPTSGRLPGANRQSCHLHHLHHHLQPTIPSHLGGSSPVGTVTPQPLPHTLRQRSHAPPAKHPPHPASVFHLISILRHPSPLSLPYSEPLDTRIQAST